jgi:hypothetical protein
MTGPVRAVLFGVTDPGQAAEAEALGIDAVVVALGGDEPVLVDPERANAIAAQLGPFTARLALVDGGAGALPPGYGGVVTEAGTELPPEAGVNVLRTRQERPAVDPLTAPADALWVRPAAGGSGSATRFDFRQLERWSRRHRLVVEIPDGAAGVEVVVRLARPHAVLFGSGVWFGPGLVDLDRLEQALGVLARLNKAAFP